MIRSVERDDAGAIRDIQNHYIENTIFTFEEEKMSVERMHDRIREVTESLPWLVFEEGGVLIGYAYATWWKSRAAYRHSVESTVYLSPHATGRGIGSRLYDELIGLLGDREIHAAVGGIALPNPASVALHEKMGFEKVAHFREVGRKFNQWIDVGYWERIIRFSRRRRELR